MKLINLADYCQQIRRQFPISSYTELIHNAPFMEAGQGQKTTLRSPRSSFWPFTLEDSATHINYYCRFGSAGGSWCVVPTSFSSARSATPASAASSTWPGPTRNTPTPPQTPPRPRPPPITRKSSRRWVSVAFTTYLPRFPIIASARLRDSASYS